MSWNRLAGCHGTSWRAVMEPAGGLSVLPRWWLIYRCCVFFLEMDQLWNNASSNKNKYIDIGVMNLALD
jgi:hypothetical protein